jgi:hypothetical protein
MGVKNFHCNAIMDDNGKWKLVVMLVKKWQESRRI